MEWMIPAAAAVLTGYASFILPAQWLKLERVHYDLGLRKKILQISDLHVEMLRVSPERLERMIRLAVPDWIVLTGDFTRKLRYLPRLEPYLKMLAGLGVPLFAVPGNHDYKLNGSAFRLFELLTRYRIRLLRNESVELDRCTLVGIDNYSTGHSRLPKAFAGVNPGRGPVIVITHDPNVVLAIRRHYDYLMAGHLHGKQFNIPFFFKLKTKGELPARGIYKGLHQSEQGYYYISKGIGQAGLNARFLVRSEITLHEL